MTEVPYLSPAAIESQTRDLLVRHGVLRAPVPVELLAYRLGLTLESATLGDGVSGLLVVDGGKGAIGYSKDHQESRQRFTIAHEIGHYILHVDAQKLFIDKAYVYKRDQASSAGEDRREIQANLFASALLMPEELVRDELEALEFDIADEDALKDLADRFKVSRQAMLFRLSHLGIFAESAI